MGFQTEYPIVKIVLILCIFKMQQQEICACNISRWYNQFKEITVPTVVLPMPVDCIQWILQDGIIVDDSSRAVSCTKPLRFLPETPTVLFAYCRFLRDSRMTMALIGVTSLMLKKLKTRDHCHRVLAF